LNQKEATDTGAQAVERYPYNREKNVLIRRSTPDRSQRIRRIVQLLFVALNGLLGVQFLLWVRYFESGGNSMYVPRPAGVEGWLPIAGLMNLKYFLLTGHVPSIHPAAMFLFIAFVLMSLLLKKASVPGCARSGHSLRLCGGWAAKSSGAICAFTGGPTFRFAA